MLMTVLREEKIEHEKQNSGLLPLKDPFIRNWKLLKRTDI